MKLEISSKLYHSLKNMQEHKIYIDEFGHTKYTIDLDDLKYEESDIVTIKEILLKYVKKEAGPYAGIITPIFNFLHNLKEEK